MLRGGEAVLVAVSGGADSVALLDVLCELRAALGLRLEAAHVHHGLRPGADADAEFTRELARRLAVPFHLERVAVRRGPPWDGLEAEARRARLAALETRARGIGAARIATAHTADDQAETVLMRLLAGAGPRGLGGIAPVRGRFIRPLLESRRADVLTHLESRGLGWVQDPSNADPRFLRNRIRHDVLPYLARVCGTGVTEALCRSAALSRAAVHDLEERARAEVERLATRGPGGAVFAVDDVRALGPELAAAALLQTAALLGDDRPRRGAVHRGIRRLLGASPPRRPLRLGRLVMERSGRWLRVGPAALPALQARHWDVPGDLALDEVGLRLEAHRFERSEDYRLPRERHRVAFDADRLAWPLAVRPRRLGDRFMPFGGAGERRLKSLLSDEGVPRWERDRVPLLDAGGRIAWVVGVRRGDVAIVGPETKRILEVTVFPL
jgi:tRNA(Ile)-lysidine synthase